MREVERKGRERGSERVPERKASFQGSSSNMTLWLDPTKHFTKLGHLGVNIDFQCHDPASFELVLIVTPTSTEFNIHTNKTYS